MGSFGYGAAGLPSGAVGVTSVEANKAFAPVMQVHSGADDDQPTLWDEAHFYRECSNKGVCNRQSGVCQCFKGYDGEGCTRTACPNACSGHGTCERLVDQDVHYRAWDAYKTQRCKCDPGYLGPDCSLRDCPMGDDPITHTQLDEVQVLAFRADTSGLQLDSSQYHGVFALQFKDEFGDTWTTKTLSWPSARASGTGVDAIITAGTGSDDEYGITDSTARGAHTTAAELKAALKALPNDAIPDCEVTFVEEIDAGWEYGITFTHNSGPLDNMHVLYEITAAAGTVTGDASAVADASDSTTGATVYDSAGLKGNPYPDTCATTGYVLVHDGTNGDRDGTDTFSSGKCGTGAISGGHTGVVGNKENTICSDRGVCDYSTGLCKCFNGYTNADCSQQNALAMS
jgi:hypothetical protein